MARAQSLNPDGNSGGKRRRSGWPIFSGILTLIYIASALWFVWPVGQPLGAAGILTLADQLHRLGLNEFGDFLSGFFAPLAFLWLATAVLMQAQELKAQRQELEFTRRVTQATREQIADQTASLKVQSEVLQAQLEEQKRRSADEGFSRLLDQLVKLIQTRIVGRHALRLEGEHKFTLNLIQQRPAAGDRDSVLAGYSDALMTAARHYAQGTPDGFRYEMSPAMARNVDDLRSLLDNLASRVSEASASTHVLVRTIRFHDLQDAVDEIHRMKIGPA